MVYVVISSLWELLEANERDSSTGGLQRTSEVLLNLVSLPGNKANTSYSTVSIPMCDANYLSRKRHMKSHGRTHIMY